MSKSATFLPPILVLLLVSTVASAHELIFTIDFSPYDLTITKYGEYDQLYLKGAVSTTEIGAPMLPMKSISIVAPPDMKVDSVVIDTVESFIMAGFYTPFPVQPPVPISEEPGPFVPPDAKFYSCVYPDRIIQFVHQGSMFGYNIASLLVFPARYEPEKYLRFYKTIQFTLKMSQADLNYIEPNYSIEARRRKEDELKRIVFNPGDIELYSP